MSDNTLDPTMAVAYHSGFGHTATLAQSVADGVRSVGAVANIIAVERITDADAAPVEYGQPLFLLGV